MSGFVCAIVMSILKTMAVKQNFRVKFQTPDYKMQPYIATPFLLTYDKAGS